MIVDSFDGFKIYNLDDKYSFIYADFDDEEKFLKGLVEYIFKEENLIRYAGGSVGVNFNPGKKQYVMLYKQISKFLNPKMERVPIKDLESDLIKIVKDEYNLFVGEDGVSYISPDKIGKLGEYILHLLLSNYFKYTCVVPKINLSTNRNMSVFGIDVLFWDESSKEFIFGESKVSNSIDNGITLINKSLKGYDESITEEFGLTLSNPQIRKSEKFDEEYSDVIDECYTFQEFAEKVKIDNIVVPIFIAHGDGNKLDVEKILNKFNKVHTREILGINTKYLFISLPIIDKEKFSRYALELAVSKQNEYKSK